MLEENLGTLGITVGGHFKMSTVCTLRISYYVVLQ